MDSKEGFNSKKLVLNYVKQVKKPESDEFNTSTNCNPNAKISLIGIRRQKNGRHAAVITDQIRHKKVWLGTFDTVEEASRAYLSKKSEFENEKLRLQGKKKSKRIHENTRIVGGNKKNKRVKYISEITNPISKNRIWLDTFGNVEEASRVNQSKKLEFTAMQRQCTNGGSEIDVPISNSCNGGTDRRIASHEIGTAEEGFRIAKEGSRVVNSGLIANAHGAKSSDECNNTTSSNLKDKISLVGIRRRKSGRYSAKITDPIKHKEVCLGTFDTIEEASQAYFSKKSEFEKLRHENKLKKNCDQIQQPESESVVASFDTARASGRYKRMDSYKTTPHIIGANKSKTSGRYTSEITNPITKKKIWLGTFRTAEEASHAYQSKKLEFQKLVKAKQQQCTNKQKKSEKLVNCEPFQPDAARSPDIDVPFSNSFNGGTVQSTDSDKIGTGEEAFRAYQSKKFDPQSSKKVELQNITPTDQEDEDLWKGEWVKLPGDDREVMFSLKLGLPIIDNYGYLLGEFSSSDDLSICVTEDDNQT